MNTQILPRFDLREPAFRKYERDIAKACQSKEHLVDFARLIVMKLTARTYCIRFRDATLGYRTYGYSSEIIPKNSDTTQLRCYETSDGGVLIRNLAFEGNSTAVQQATSAPTQLSVGQTWEAIHSLAEQLGARKVEGSYSIHYTNEAERAKLNSLQSGPGAFDVYITFDDKVGVAVMS